MLLRPLLYVKILFLCIILNAKCIAQDIIDTTSHFKVVQLASGVFACIHEFGGEGICNSGVINMGNYTVVIDPFMSPKAAVELLQWIEYNSLPPVKYVINTHYHNDHVRGNQVFNQNVDIVSTRKTAELIASEEPKAIAAESNYAPDLCARFSAMKSGFKGDTLDRSFLVLKMMQPYFCTLQRSKDEILTRTPNLIFETKMIIGESRKLEIIDMGEGHTPSDVVVYLPEEGILFAADLVTGDFHPYLPDGNPESWIEILTEMLKWPIKWVVPGHGYVGQINLIQSTSNYISDLLDTTYNLDINSNMDNEDFNMTIPNTYINWWLDQFYLDNVKFVFTRRTEKK